MLRPQGTQSPAFWVILSGDFCPCYLGDCKMPTLEGNELIPLLHFHLEIGWSYSGGENWYSLFKRGGSRVRVRKDTEVNPKGRGGAESKFSTRKEPKPRLSICKNLSFSNLLWYVHTLSELFKASVFALSFPVQSTLTQPFYLKTRISYKILFLYPEENLIPSFFTKNALSCLQFTFLFFYSCLIVPLIYILSNFS